jgi:hypothetical protein
MQLDSSRASVPHLHILRLGSSSLSHQLVTPYYKHLGARQYKTFLPTGCRAFFGPNQYKSLVFFLHTIRISYAQTLIHLLGLGPLVQTPTVGAPSRGSLRVAATIPCEFQMATPLRLGTVIWFESLEFMSLGYDYDMVLLPPRAPSDSDSSSCR